MAKPVQTIKLQRPTDASDAAQMLDQQHDAVLEVQEQVEAGEIDDAITKLDDVILELQNIREGLEEMK